MARTSDADFGAASDDGPPRRANVGAARTSSDSTRSADSDASEVAEGGNGTAALVEASPTGDSGTSPPAEGNGTTADSAGTAAAAGPLGGGGDPAVGDQLDRDAPPPSPESPASDWGDAAPGVVPLPQPAPRATPRKPPLRTRILPRSVLGVASLILAFAVGAGFSGVVLFSYYQYKLNQTNQRVNTLISGYKKQFTNSEGDLAAAVAAAKLNIQSQLNAVQQLQASPAVLAGLVRQLAPSMFFVHTLDASGQPSVGSAFVVSSTPTQSLLLTSYTTVEAATHAPAPPVFVRQNNSDTQVTVRTWDPQYDLALLVVARGGLRPLTAAPATPAPEPSDRIYAVSGLGSAGASIAQGSIVDVSAEGIAEDAAIGPAFQGGPLVNKAGQVIAVGSRTYAPLGFTSDGVWFAPYVEAACNKVLTCPGGTLTGSH